MLGIDMFFVLNVSLLESAQMRSFCDPYLPVVVLNTDISRVDLPCFHTLGEYFCVTISIILGRHWDALSAHGCCPANVQW